MKDYIYCLVMEKTNEPFYVGRSFRPLERWKQHLAEAKKGGKSAKCRILRDNPCVPVILEKIIVENKDENPEIYDTPFKHLAKWKAGSGTERNWIYNFEGNGYLITNSKSGDDNTADIVREELRGDPVEIQNLVNLQWKKMADGKVAACVKGWIIVKERLNKVSSLLKVNMFCNDAKYIQNMYADEVNDFIVEKSKR